MFVRFAHEVTDRIYRSIVASIEGSPTLKPILRPYDTVGTTRYVDFHTIRETYKTRADKCHVSHVARDSGWEFKLAHDLEDMSEVLSYVKNQNLGFTILARRPPACAASGGRTALGHDQRLLHGAVNTTALDRSS
jgi:type III restriction enzyme